MGYGKWLAGFMGWAVAGPIGALLGFGIGAVVEGVVESSSLQKGDNIHTGARNSFLLSLMVLSAAVMKADGKVMRSELDYVKDFIRHNFGEGAVGEALRLLKVLLQKNVPVDEICDQIVVN
ncbi:MAG: TerB family tellurite resistance protein, partial [Alistipes sp.]|nr:TerB family tellurite resistance protein [Candidatus Minthomonas equi]